jgi:hypothetical protein
MNFHMMEATGHLLDPSLTYFLGRLLLTVLRVNSCLSCGIHLHSPPLY